MSQTNNSSSQAFICFTSKRHQLSHPQCKQYFYSIKPCGKLYVNTMSNYGKVYYSSVEEVEYVIEQVKKNNTLDLDFYAINDEKTVMSNNNINTEVNEFVFDANGQKIAILADTESKNTFISLTQANKGGCLTFPSPTAAQDHLLKDLKEFVGNQVEMYLKCVASKYNLADFEIDIKFKINNAITPCTPPVHNNIVNKSYAPRNELKANQINNHHTSQTNSRTVGERNKAKDTASNHSAECDAKSASPKINHSKSPLEMLKSFKKKPTTLLNKLEIYPRANAFVDTMGETTAEITLQVLKAESIGNEPDGMSSFLGFFLCPAFDDALERFDLENELLTPKVGEMVMVRRECESYSRAYILEISGEIYHVALIDYAEIRQVRTVYEITSHLKEFDEFTCICTAPSSVVGTFLDDGCIVAVPVSNNLCKDSATGTEIRCVRWIPKSYMQAAVVNTPPRPPKQQICTSLPTEMSAALQVGQRVKIIGFRDGHLFLRTKETHDLLKTMQDKQYDELQKPPVVGQFVMFEDGQFWKRCLVKTIQTDQSVIVSYVDYCSDATLQIDQLRNLPQAAMFGPTLYKTRLRNFEDMEFSETAHAKLLEMIKFPNFIVTELEGNVIEVKEHRDDGKYLAQTLLQVDGPEILQLSDLPCMPKLEMNKEFDIIVMHSTDTEIFFIHLLQEVPTLADLTNLTSMGDVVEGQLCAAPFDDDWYRAEVKKCDGNQVSVYFIDFGNTECIEKSCIKPLPDEMLQFAPVAMNAVLESDSCDDAQNTIQKVYTAIIVGKEANKYKMRLLKQVSP